MVKSQADLEPRKPRRPSALTPEARENQLISLAVDLAEKQLRDGTASAQVQTHYLKLATARERLEREKLTRENELLRARTDSLAKDGHTEALYEEAINAMRMYQGHPPVNTDNDDNGY